MPRLIKGGAVVADRWTLLREARGLGAVPPRGAVIVPLPLWRAERDALRARGDVGVLLAPDDEPAGLADDLAALPVVAVDFPQFTDGRGYSTARLLRERYGYHGELRAVGDVLRDQLFALAECGFDAFDVRADRDPAAALAGLDDFATVYASTARTRRPWFRRRIATPSTPSTPSQPGRPAAGVR
jgi:uncharacterized protein (DUF934 family)